MCMYFTYHTKELIYTTVISPETPTKTINERELSADMRDLRSEKLELSAIVITSQYSGSNSVAHSSSKRSSPAFAELAIMVVARGYP